MSNTGWLSPSSAANLGTGTSWTSPTNVLLSDDVRASITPLASLDDSKYLKAYNYSIVLPAGSTIDGVETRIEWYSTDTAIEIGQVKLLDTTGNEVGDLRGNGTTRTTEGYDVQGSPTDLWGNALTQSWVENSNFGFAFDTINTDLKDGFNVYADHMQIRVYYTAPGGNQVMIMGMG